MRNFDAKWIIKASKRKYLSKFSHQTAKCLHKASVKV